MVVAMGLIASRRRLVGQLQDSAATSLAPQLTRRLAGHWLAGGWLG
jgi:hypothetical protein